MLKFLPDAPDTEAEALMEVSAVPTVRGYASPPAGVDSGIAALAASPQGGVLVVKLDDSRRTIAGTVSKLYEVSGSSWSDVSRAGNYSIGSNRWRFSQFGNTSLAINKSTVLQQSSSGAFADVTASPKAALMEAVAGFVLLANTDDTALGITGGPGADQPHRWWCSQFQNPTGSWAPASSTQANTGLLVETEGPITALRRLLNDCIAYKARSIYVGRYVGPPAVWQWQCVSKDIGCSSHEGVVDAGTVHYFIGDNDIYAFDGSRPVPIGQGVREWFFARLNRTYIGSILSLHDRATQRVFWFYPTSSSTLDSCLVYHYATQRWGHFSQTVVDVLEAVTNETTYDELGSLYSTYDDMPNIPYDSPFWSAATPVLAYFNSSFVLHELSGDSLALTLTTAWFGDESVVSMCDRLTPRYRDGKKPTAATVTPRSCMELGGTETVGSAVAVNGNRFNVRQAARFHQFALSLTGSCEIEALAPTLTPESEE